MNALHPNILVHDYDFRTHIAMNRAKQISTLPFLMRPTHISVSVIVPAMNEAKNLQYVLPRIPDWVDEVLLVDGNSTDNTIEMARSLCPDIRIVQQQGRGKGAALRTGFAAATGEIIVMLDADGSTDPAEMPAFVGALLAGADFVKGSRFLQGGGTSDMSFHRKFGNWCFVIFSRMLFGGHYSDLCYGYNAFYSRILSQIDLDGRWLRDRDTDEFACATRRF